jgi:hypothetical protein
MPRRVPTAILRSAALLAPAPARAEWLAEWTAELWYVERDATAFCLGSFRDALSLRMRSFSLRRAVSLDSPLRCLLLLSALAASALVWAVVCGDLLLPSQPDAESKQFGIILFWMYLESFLVLLTLNPLGLGEYPANRDAPSLPIRLRRWVFLAGKIVLFPPIVFFAAVALAPVFPAAAWALFVGLIAGLRWVFADQRRRCPVCLHFLSHPVAIGSPAHTLFQQHGTKVGCARGHGSLFVPSAPTSWCAAQSWQYVDRMRGGNGEPRAAAAVEPTAPRKDGDSKAAALKARHGGQAAALR